MEVVGMKPIDITRIPDFNAVESSVCFGPNCVFSAVIFTSVRKSLLVAGKCRQRSTLVFFLLLLSRRKHPGKLYCIRKCVSDLGRNNFRSKTENYPLCMRQEQKYLYFIEARSKHGEKRLLALSCVSVRMGQVGLHWTNFHKILYLRIFPKSVEKIQV